MRKELLDTLPSCGVAYDSETWLITPKRLAPPLVCASFKTNTQAKIVDKNDAKKLFQKILEPGIVIIGANIAFDMAVGAVNGFASIKAVFDKYLRGEIYDVLLAQMLDAIGGGYLGRDPRDGGNLRDPATGKQVGRYSLSIVCDHVLGRKTAKENDYWRERYAILEDIPIADWPEEARQYPVDDVVNTWDAAMAQAGLALRSGGELRRADNLHAMSDIAAAAFALHLGAIWGFATDQERVDRMVEETETAIAAGCERFVELGLIHNGLKTCKACGSKARGTCKPSSKNTAAVKRLVAVAYGAADPCPECEGSGKVPSPKNPDNRINCIACSGTGLDVHTPETVPLTAPSKKFPLGAVQTARDVLVDSGDENLYDFGEWGEQAKIVSTYAPALKEGLPLRPNVPLANERVSYSGIVQTMPRGGAVRECVVARPGYHLSSIDFAGIEMVTWAQVCIWLLGRSDLADAINGGADAHSLLGADLCGRTYEEFLELLKAGDKTIANYRQAAKAGNFTFAGGGGAAAFVKAKRKEPGMTTVGPDGKVWKGTRFCLLVGGAEVCGVEKIYEWRGRATGVPLCKRCVECAADIRAAWMNRWSEAKPYFNHVSRVVEEECEIVHFGSGVVRGGVEFTSAANGYFSSLAAVGAKRGFVAASYEALTDRDSCLFGSRPIAFIHDEAVSEHPKDRSHEAAVRMGELMVAKMQEVVPDVKVKTEPALMTRLYKGAKPVFENGRLVPWEPRA